MYILKFTPPDPVLSSGGALRAQTGNMLSENQQKSPETKKMDAERERESEANPESH